MNGTGSLRLRHCLDGQGLEGKGISPHHTRHHPSGHWGTTFGLAEETMAFYPILIPVFIAAGYDAMVGLAASTLALPSAPCAPPSTRFP